MQPSNDTAPDEKRFQALFRQNFRFDVSSQQPYFYREVQRFLAAGLCVELTKEYREGSDNKLCSTSFDPVLLFNGNKERLVDSLLSTCLVLVRHQLCETDVSAVIQRQYSEVCEYFRQKWRSLSNETPVVDDVINLFLIYPHWHRSAELLGVIRLGPPRSVYT